MRKLILALLLLSTSMVHAQEITPQDAAFLRLDVANVRLELSADNGAVLLFNSTSNAPDYCDDLFVDTAVNGQFIEVNAYIPELSAPCEDASASFEWSIALPDLETEQTYLLLFNNHSSRFYLPSPDTAPSEVAFPITWEETNDLTRLNRVQSTTTTVLFAEDDGNLSLRLSGTHPDSCETDHFIQFAPDVTQSNLYHVTVYRFLPQGVICDQDIQFFSDTFTTDLPIEVADTYLNITGTIYYIDDTTADIVVQDDLAVENVTVEAEGDDFEVVVAGQASANCDLNSYQSDNDYSSVISIVAYVPEDIDCESDGINYEEVFTVVTLPVIVNGMAYDENGVVTPPATAQDVDDNEGDGNFLRVNTVIENVEVAILESFPMQLQLTVTGYQPDGCDLPVAVEQTVDENDVTIAIYRQVPADTFCPMVLSPYEDTIMVDGTFTGGTVTIDVNTFTTEVDLN